MAPKDRYRTHVLSPTPKATAVLTNHQYTVRHDVLPVLKVILQCGVCGAARGGSFRGGGRLLLE